jgi:hypothetical protein
MKRIHSLSIAFAILLFALTQLTLADSEIGPRERVTVAQGGLCFFTMIPAVEEWDGNRYRTIKPAFGVAYRLEPNGNIKTLWKTKGWYSSQIFMTYDGEYLVAMGPWSKGHESAEGDLAVSFYKRGELLRSYSTAELVLDHSKVEATVSHYFWRSYDPENTMKLERNNQFKIRTIDEVLYTFDVTTGEIVSVEEGSPVPENASKD